MRLVGTTKQMTVVERLVKALVAHRIHYVVESSENLDWGSEQYGTITWTIWVVEEKEVGLAKLLFLETVNTPEMADEVIASPAKLPEPTVEEKITSKPRIRTLLTPICSLLMILCALVFVTSSLTENRSIPAASPLRRALLFDEPKALEALIQHPKEPPATPFFPGYYRLFELFHGNLVEAVQAGSSLPKCEKISQGELWRVFTPCLMHQDIFHLIFNMFWLLMLGPPLERLLTPTRFLLFTLLAAIITNTAQYFMSGFTFLGASGLIAAYGGYIFSALRRRESGPFSLLKDQVRFLLWMIIFFALLSVVELGLALQFSFHLPFSFANTAHCTGFAFGYLCAKWNKLLKQ